MEKMFKAYDAARRLVAEELSSYDAESLREVEDSDVVVVRGTYDRVEDVLRIVGIKHRVVAPEEVGALRLHPEQLLILNCPGEIGRRGVSNVRAFVEAGGSLFATDWALKHVLEPAFPGVVAYNKRPTADDVVRIEVLDRENPYLEGMFHEGADPLWWLEGSSYPIRILDRSRVQVLLTSRELEQKYGEAPVGVTFPFGGGEVFHMISHYYLQRAETRTQRHASNWGAYAAEKNMAGVAVAAPPDLADLSVAEVEAAHSSLRMMTNVIARKRRQVREGKG